jgi:hypothetical protein
LGPDSASSQDVGDLLAQFLQLRDVDAHELSTDQLLSAVHLRLGGVGLDPALLRSAVLRPLDDTDPQ